MRLITGGLSKPPTVPSIGSVLPINRWIGCLSGIQHRPQIRAATPIACVTRHANGTLTRSLMLSAIRCNSSTGRNTTTTTLGLLARTTPGSTCKHHASNRSATARTQACNAVRTAVLTSTTNGAATRHLRSLIVEPSRTHSMMFPMICGADAMVMLTNTQRSAEKTHQHFGHTSA